MTWLDFPGYFLVFGAPTCSAADRLEIIRNGTNLRLSLLLIDISVDHCCVWTGFVRQDITSIALTACPVQNIGSRRCKFKLL